MRFFKGARKISIILKAAFQAGLEYGMACAELLSGGD